MHFFTQQEREKEQKAVKFENDLIKICIFFHPHFSHGRGRLLEFDLKFGFSILKSTPDNKSAK